MRIEHVKIIDSTNEEMKRRADKKEYDIFYADTQTNGKGRRGNKWLSNEGAALFTFVLEDKNYKENISLFTGYIVYKQISKMIKSKKLEFKWPNDIYYDGKKLCGILAEKSEKYLLVGIGINVNNTDFGIYKDTITSIKEITGKNYEIEEIITNIVKEVKEELEDIERNWNMIIDFLNKHHMLNEKLVENSNKEEYKIKEINNNGSLKVKKMNEKKYTNIYSDEIKGIKIKKSNKTQIIQK